MGSSTRRSRLAVHHSSKTPEHYTPADFLALVYAVFEGVPDLDPCCESREHPNVDARQHYTRDDDGLALPWHGRVFVNPPYGREIEHWTRKMRAEWARGTVVELIALLPARTDTAWFHTLIADTDAPIVCMMRGRLRFVDQRSSAPFPSMAVYFGQRPDVFAAIFGPRGLCATFDVPHQQAHAKIEVDSRSAREQQLATRPSPVHSSMPSERATRHFIGSRREARTLSVQKGS
jgi:hypothetical protein